MKKCSSSRPEVFCKKGFLNISQNSYESTGNGVFFYLRYRSQGFSCEFCKILWTAAFETMFSIEQFPVFQSDDVIIFAHRIGNADTVKILNFRDAQACNFNKKETLPQVFPCEFCEISKTTFFYRTPPVAASVLWRLNFMFSMRRLSSFLNFMKTWTTWQRQL